jgi:hypothetical protein
MRTNELSMFIPEIGVVDQVFIGISDDMVEYIYVTGFF